MSKTEYKLRAAEFHDAEAIFSLIKKYPETLLARPIGDIVQNIDRFLVCARGEEVVGTVSWQILPEIGAPRQPSVEIKSLAVEQQYRKTGAGRLLVQGAIEHIIPLHPTQIVVLTFTPQFFAKFGFREIAKETLMHKLYMGCINCTKYNSPFTCPEIAMAMDLNPGNSNNQGGA